MNSKGNSETISGAVTREMQRLKHCVFTPRKKQKQKQRKNMAAKKPIGKRIEPPAGANEESEPTEQAPKKRKAGSLAALFDEATPGNTLPNGDYNAKITEFEVMEPNDKGLAAKIQYTVLEGEEKAGETVTQYYQLQTADGEPGKGLGFLKRDLATLGYDDVAGDALEETLETIAGEEPEVVITVKQNGQWTNAYLKGLIDDGN
jgi:hypothetical protein